MILRLVVLLFLILEILKPAVLTAEVPSEKAGQEKKAEQEDLKAVIDAFNQSVDREAENKMREAEEADSRGEYRKAREMFREALLLKSLQVEEGRISDEKVISLKDAMSPAEKKIWIKRFVKEGDRMASLGFYDLAVDEYEKVFLLDADNRTASDRIDHLKKRYIREKTEEMNRQGKQVDEEIRRRAEIYIHQAEELIQADNLLAAKRVLQRVLVLEPKNKQAKKMLKSVEKQVEA